jgi:hypothetical protein
VATALRTVSVGRCATDSVSLASTAFDHAAGEEYSVHLFVPAAVGCVGTEDGPPRETAPEDVAGVEKGWETDCVWSSTCGAAGKRYVICSDPNEAMHYHFDGRSCMCESSRRSCGECDPYAPCSCAFDVGEWCRAP